MSFMCFITPKTVLKLTVKGSEFIPVLGPTVEFAKKSKKMTELTDPVSATSRGVGMLFNYCFGKAGAMSVECILWFGLSSVGGLTCNPALIAAGAQFGSMLVDEIID